jgi:hypothetical protein
MSAKRTRRTASDIAYAVGHCRMTVRAIRATTH